MYIFSLQGEHGCNPLLPQITSFSPLETFAHPSCRFPIHPPPPPPAWGRPKCAGSRGGTHGAPHELVKGHEHPNIPLISKQEKRNTWKYPVIIQGSRDLSWTNTFVSFTLHVCVRDRLHWFPKPEPSLVLLVAPWRPKGWFWSYGGHQANNILNIFYCLSHFALFCNLFLCFMISVFWSGIRQWILLKFT